MTTSTVIIAKKGAYLFYRSGVSLTIIIGTTLDSSPQELEHEFLFIIGQESLTIFLQG